MPLPCITYTIVLLWGENFSKSWDIFPPWALTLTGWMASASCLIFFVSQFLYPYHDRVLVLLWPLRTFPSLKLPLLHSGNLRNLPLHISITCPWNFTLLTYYMLAHQRGWGISCMVWMPSMCWEHWGVFCSPHQIDAELNGRNRPVSLHLSSSHTVSLECWLHSDHTKNFIYLKKCMLSILELRIFFSTWTHLPFPSRYYI